MTEAEILAKMELLTFRLAGQEYALDIMLVREIRGWTKATPLPHAPHYIKGVINLRGTVLPVMDLSLRLSLSHFDENERSVVIVVTHEDRLIGLLVDDVSDIITLKSEDLQPPPKMSLTSASDVISGLVLIEERMIRVLDLAVTIVPQEGVAA